MVRNYTVKLIKALLNAINTAHVDKITTYKDYSFLYPMFNSADLTLKFITTNDKPDVYIDLPSFVTGEYIKQWKRETSAGKFLIKDFKLQKKDFLNNTLYSGIIYTENNVKYKALIRLLDEINDVNLTDTEKEELITSFADITIDNKVYSIVKILPYDGTEYWYKDDIYSRLKDKKNEYEIDSFNSIITTGTDDIINNENTNPLF